MASSSLHLEGLVVEADGGLEGADEVADHVLGRIVQQGGEPPARSQAGLERGGDLLHHQRVLGDREGVVAERLAVPAGDAGEAVGDVLDLDVGGRGVEQVEAPARQHALPGAWRRHRLGFVSDGFSVMRASGA